ncbi:hypothetical protein N9878_00565 [bacterium]|nr:hypothetical protein [bacterium]
MKYIAAFVVVFFSFTAQAGIWKTGDDIGAKSLCKDVDPLIKILHTKGDEAKLKIWNAAQTAGVCRFFGGMVLPFVLGERLARVDEDGVISEVWSGTFQGREFFIILDGAAGPHNKSGFKI